MPGTLAERELNGVGGYWIIRYAPDFTNTMAAYMMPPTTRTTWQNCMGSHLSRWLPRYATYTTPEMSAPVKKMPPNFSQAAIIIRGASDQYWCAFSPKLASSR